MENADMKKMLKTEAMTQACAAAAPHPDDDGDGDDDEDDDEDKELPQVPEHPDGHAGRRSAFEGGRDGNPKL
eukprot:6368240-Amphidinium_carterae.1